MIHNQKKLNFCEIFHQSVKSHPSNIAVTFNDEGLTFLELDDMSSQYASYLQEAGLNKGDVVALATYNHLKLVPLILAIWKMGGIYLPIDPNYPTERISTMLEEASPAILLTTKELKKQFRFFNGNIFLIDNKLNKSNKTNLPIVEEGDLAYIIFTSGSTGKPKGIMVDHLALTHAALAYKELHPKKYTALVAGSVSFDPSLLTIVHCLTTGGTACLYDNKEGIDIKNAQKIINLIQEKSVDFILSTPSFYTKLLKENTLLPSLVNVDLCGESITNSVINKHAQISPNAFLYNAYGPSEYAIGTSAALLFDPNTKEKFEITIGKGFADNKIYVLNSKLKETKDNEKGKIYTGGPGLAKGYMNLDSLTEKNFIWANGLEFKPTRLYRTGDLGYRLPNGNIVFTGRSDFQVKMNGHRVELEEVESIIDNLPYIEKSIVIVKTSASKVSKLVAYYKLNNPCPEETIRKDLRKVLPSYMLPSELTRIEEFLMTKNGKISREALKNHVI